MVKIILIVDDNTDVRKMMSVLLGLHGYEVIEAANGYEAIEKAGARHFDLILMDLAMPGMSGFSTVKSIRTLDNCEKTPIFALTAYSDFYEQAFESGCDEVLKKPINIKTLAPLINQYLENSI